MATSTATRTLASDPLRNFKFNVAIQQQLNGGPTGGYARLGFMGVSGLGLSIEPLTYREGGDNLTVRKMPGQADFNPVTLTRGLFPTDYDNWAWMQSIFTAMYGAGSSAPFSKAAANDFRCVVYINVLDHPNTSANATGTPYGASYPQQNNIVKMSFKLYSAWISSLGYSDLDAGGNAVGVEQMTLNYEGFDVKWGGSGYVSNPVGW